MLRLRVRVGPGEEGHAFKRVWLFPRDFQYRYDSNDERVAPAEQEYITMLAQVFEK